MNSYLIQRDIPDVGNSPKNELRMALEKSAAVILEMREEGKPINWISTHLTKNFFTCFFDCNERVHIEEHASRAGLPVSSITKIISTMTPEREVA